MPDCPWQFLPQKLTKEIVPFLFYYLINVLFVLCSYFSHNTYFNNYQISRNPLFRFRKFVLCLFTNFTWKIGERCCSRSLSFGLNKCWDCCSYVLQGCSIELLLWTRWKWKTDAIWHHIPPFAFSFVFDRQIAEGDFSMLMGVLKLVKRKRMPWLGIFLHDRWFTSNQHIT